jgi:hypothetical protein
MVDVFLIVVAVVVFFILCVGGFYLLVNYQHPDDHNDAYFPKFVVLFGFVIAGCTVLMFPLDVANKEGFPGTLQRVKLVPKIIVSTKRNNELTLGDSFYLCLLTTASFSMVEFRNRVHFQVVRVSIPVCAVA